MFSKKNDMRNTILMWTDKRDVLMLSTKHAYEIANIDWWSGAIAKPQAVMDHIKNESSIDLLGQMASYNICLGKTLELYREVAIELWFGTAMVNVHILYKKLHKRVYRLCINKQVLQKNC